MTVSLTSLLRTLRAVVSVLGKRLRAMTNAETLEGLIDSQFAGSPPFYCQRPGSRNRTDTRD